MRRKLLATAVLISALLFVATCAAWVRSRVVRDYAWMWMPWPGDPGGDRTVKIDLDSGGGQLEVSWKVWTAAERERVSRWNSLAASGFYHRTFDDVLKAYARSSPPSSWNALGFTSFSGPTHSSFGFPYWFAASITAPPAVVWLDRRFRRRRRARAGKCVACGYDLRATPGRCPECGAVAGEG